jgi:hypothetical protein
MASISDIVISNIESISSSYAQNITEPTRIMQDLSEDLRKEGTFIKTFERIAPITDRSLVAIDGGNAKEQLSGGDLIVAGATLGEGLSSKKLYSSPEEYPSEVYNSVIPHTSNNEKIEKSIRSALELRILQQVPADLKIIDGAYLGNVSSVLYALIDHDPVVSNSILELNFFDSDGLLYEAMQTILYPPRSNESYIIGVAKSDSAKYYSNMFLKDRNIKLHVTDRMLASRILRPGEFFAPRQEQSNPGLVAALTKQIGMPDFAKESSNKTLLMKMVQDKAGLLNRMGKADRTEEGILWTTYFKPTAWSEYAKAVKVDFVFYHGDSVQTPEERAREIVQIVDQDIIDESVLEPWCQYAADRGAKGVSDAINIVKNHLLSTVDNPAELRGLLRGYRT